MFVFAVVPLESGHKGMVLRLSCMVDGKGLAESGDLCALFVEKIPRGPLAVDAPMGMIGAHDEVNGQVRIPMDDLASLGSLT